MSTPHSGTHLGLLRVCLPQSLILRTFHSEVQCFRHKHVQAMIPYTNYHVKQGASLLSGLGRPRAWEDPVPLNLF